MSGKNKDFFIFGCGTSASVYYALFKQWGVGDASFFCAEKKFCNIDSFNGKQLLPLEQLTSVFDKGESFHVAIGYNGMNSVRTFFLATLRHMGFTPFTAISPSATIADDSCFSDHCFVADGVIVNPFVNVHENVTILSGAVIGHHTTILSNCYICQRVITNGLVSIGENCFIGAGSNIMDGVTIGKDCFIGGGACVRHDIPDGSFYDPITNTYCKGGKALFDKWFEKRRAFYDLCDN